MNTPNKLTIFRTCIVPVFISVYLIDSIPYNNYIAAVIFIIASLTDFFDGYIARKYNLISNFGKFLDPLADKLLVNSALLCFLIVPGNPVPFWAVFIIIMRDFIINGFRLVASDNHIVIAAEYVGKIKTTVQMVMIILVLFDFDNIFVNNIENILIYLSVVLTIVSLIECLYKNRNVFRDSGCDSGAGGTECSGSTGPDACISESENQAAGLVDMLRAKGYTISFAESCTGGMVSSLLVSVPGSSDVLRQSAVAYCNEAKENLLGVSETTIEKYTEVSKETACEMAEGVRKWAGSDVGVAVTGIAGPGGGSGKFPVGLVYIGISSGGRTDSFKYIFDGGRNDVRKQAAFEALRLTIDTIR